VGPHPQHPVPVPPSQPPFSLPSLYRIALWALAQTIGFAFLAGVLPRGPAAGMNRGVEEEYFENLVK
jgi:hypothetical protein